MKSDNEYEAAFEAYLRKRGAAVVPVVEARRSYLDVSEVKSPDFIAITASDARLVVDVKGRRFPCTSRNGKSRNVWHNWCERESVLSLTRWADKLGEGFQGVLAFVYRLAPSIELPPGTPDQFPFRGRLFLIRGVLANDYSTHMRRRSPRWRTVYLLSDDFQDLVHPFSHFLGCVNQGETEVPRDAMTRV